MERHEKKKVEEVAKELINWAQNKDSEGNDDEKDVRMAVALDKIVNATWK